MPEEMLWLQVFVKHAIETNMTTKLRIYLKYLMCIYGGCMCIRVPHMKYVH